MGKQKKPTAAVKPVAATTTVGRLPALVAALAAVAAGYFAFAKAGSSGTSGDGTLHRIRCSKTYKPFVEGCSPSGDSCGHVVKDGFASTDEVAALEAIATRGMALGGGAGGRGGAVVGVVVACLVQPAARRNDGAVGHRGKSHGGAAQCGGHQLCARARDGLKGEGVASPLALGGAGRVAGLASAALHPPRWDTGRLGQHEVDRGPVELAHVGRAHLEQGVEGERPGARRGGAEHKAVAKRLKMHAVVRHVVGTCEQNVLRK